MNFLKGVFNKELSETKTAIILVLPALIFIAIINVYPIIYSLYISTFSIRGLITEGFVGISNYVDLLTSSRFWGSIIATAYFTIGTIAVQTILGMIFALALNERFKGRGIVRTIFIVPWAIPSSMAALMWGRFFDPIDGYINATLRYIGLLDGNIYWFLNSFLAITAVIWVDSWKMTPLYMLVFLAGLQGIPKTLYEQASVEGANSIQTFLYITLPILKPVILTVLILRTMLVFHAFDIIYLLTQGGPGDSTRVLAFYAYQESFSFMQYGRGAAMAVILFVMTAVITFLYFKVFQAGSTTGA